MQVRNLLRGRSLNERLPTARFFIFDNKRRIKSKPTFR